LKRGYGLLYGLIGLMVTFWSGNFIVGKLALRNFPPLLLVGLRAALAGAFILPVYWWEGRREAHRWKREDVPGLILMGLFGVALNQFFFVMGLSRTSVAHSAIISGLGPMLVLLTASLAGLERLTARKAIGMTVALAGVAVLKSFEGKSSGATWTGDVLTFLGGATFAIFTVAGKRAAARHTSVTVNTFAYCTSGLALAPVTLWQAWDFPFAGVAAMGWVALAYMALFPSVVCYLIYYYALRKIAASRLSAFSYLQPLLATTMGVALLGEHIGATLVVGGTVIFSGVYLAERGR